MNHQELMDKLLEDKEFARVYNNSDVFLEISSSIQELRVRHGLTQEALAKKTGLHQEAIARLENPGYSTKYLKTLDKIARACQTELIAPKFKELEDEKRAQQLYLQEDKQRPNFKIMIKYESRAAQNSLAKTREQEVVGLSSHFTIFKP